MANDPPTPSQPAKPALVDAIQRQTGAKNVFHKHAKDDDDVNEVFCFLGARGSGNASDFVHMLRALPAALGDVQGHSDVLAKLVEIVIEQQGQISQLTAHLENLLRARIALQAQQNVYEVLERLTAQGSDVRRPEAIVKLRAETSSVSSEESDARDASLETSSASVTAGVSAILRTLAGGSLHGSRSLGQLEEKLSRLSRRVFEASQERYQGDIVIRFEEVTGDPMRQAEADLKRAEAELLRARVRSGAAESGEPQPARLPDAAS